MKRVDPAGPKTWARPAIAEGKLFIRNKERIFVYGLRE